MLANDTLSKTIIMKTHKSLKELLLDYENEKDQMYNRPVGVDQDDEMFIHYYVSNNCLVSGKQRPLAKNKQYGSSYKQDPDFKCSFPNCNCDGFKC